MLARKITGSKKGKPFGKFWDALAYTRILFTRLEELSLKGYFAANRIERDKGGEARADYLLKWNAYIGRLRKVRAVKS